MNLEKTILNHLLHNEEYARKVLPFVKTDYFLDNSQRILYEKILDYTQQYNTVPTREALAIEIDNDSKISEGHFNEVVEMLSTFSEPEAETNIDWLVDTTEKFCQEKAVYNAIMESIKIIDGKDKQLGKAAIPEILSEALAVSFDNNVGHDFLEDVGRRYDFYHKVEERIPFDLDYLNRITKGGLPRKTLNIILAGTGVGKSLFMCHMAANNLMQGKNVLYITMEMAEERIAERIDANLLNTPVDDLQNLPREMYEKKVAKLRERTPGKLIIKEYPTTSAGAGHFRHLINELALKKNFKPDIVYIDYLNICTSMRFKPGSNVNSYMFVKAIAEELRGLAVEKNVPIISATQTTRSGFTSSDPGLEDTSESFGLPATADLMFALIATEELQNLNQIMVKQLKNRYSDPTSNKRFVIGVDRPKMKLYDVEQAAQAGIMEGPDPEEQSWETKRKRSNFFEKV